MELLDSARAMFDYRPRAQETMAVAVGFRCTEALWLVRIQQRASSSAVQIDTQPNVQHDFTIILMAKQVSSVCAAEAMLFLLSQHAARNTCRHELGVSKHAR